MRFFTVLRASIKEVQHLLFTYFYIFITIIMVLWVFVEGPSYVGRVSTKRHAVSAHNGRFDAAQTLCEAVYDEIRRTVRSLSRYARKIGMVRRINAALNN